MQQAPQVPSLTPRQPLALHEGHCSTALLPCKLRGIMLQGLFVQG